MRVIAIIPYHDYNNPEIEGKYLEEVATSLSNSFHELGVVKWKIVIASNANRSSGKLFSFCKKFQTPDKGFEPSCSSRNRINQTEKAGKN